MNKKTKIFDVVISTDNPNLIKLRILEFIEVVDYFLIFTEQKNLIDQLPSSDKIFVFENSDDEFEELKKFILSNFESFEDLIFFSKDNEIPDFNDLEKINEEIKKNDLIINHKTFYWNIDYLKNKNEYGSFVSKIVSFLSRKTHGSLVSFLPKNLGIFPHTVESGWKFISFHEERSDELFFRENLIPTEDYDPITTYKLINNPLTFELPKNINIIGYNKVGREYMKKHLFIVDSGKENNIFEIKKLYDTVSIIEFSDNIDEIIAENIGESVYKNVLFLPNKKLYGVGIGLKDFQEIYKKNEIKRIIETVFPQEQDNIRIIYKDFYDLSFLWSDIKEQTFSEIINPS
jgi:hypothetical protein